MNFKSWYKGQGYSRDQVSALLDVSPKVIASIEKGERKPSSAINQKLRSRLNIFLDSNGMVKHAK